MSIAVLLLHSIEPGDPELTPPELAAAVGALIAGPISDIYSRKYSISAWVFVFAIGVIIQTAGNYNVATMYGQ